MRKYIAGFLAGVLFSFAATAFAARIVGGSGYLIGWSVTADGEEVCDDPHIWPATKEIECD